jgi:hypothetical protein
MKGTECTGHNLLYVSFALLQKCTSGPSVIAISLQYGYFVLNIMSHGLLNGITRLWLEAMLLKGLINTIETESLVLSMINSQLNL